MTDFELRCSIPDLPARLHDPRVACPPPARVVQSKRFRWILCICSVDLCAHLKGERERPLPHSGNGKQPKKGRKSTDICTEARQAAQNGSRRTTFIQTPAVVERGREKLAPLEERLRERFTAIAAAVSHSQQVAGLQRPVGPPAQFTSPCSRCISILRPPLASPTNFSGHLAVRPARGWPRKVRGQASNVSPG